MVVINSKRMSDIPMYIQKTTQPHWLKQRLQTSNYSLKSGKSKVEE